MCDGRGARLAAEATAMYEALRDIVQCARMDGELVDDMGAPRHDLGCGCGTCLAVVTLVRVEGGGRCAICGCTGDNPCEDACAWTSAARVCCDAHPVEAIAHAEALFAARAGPRRLEDGAS